MDDIDLKTQAELEAAKREFDRVAADVPRELQSLEREVAAASAAIPPEEPTFMEPTPAEAATFGKMEKEFGVRDVIRTAATVAGQLFAQQRQQQTTAEPQWFYAKGTESHGPVSQSELLKMFADGALPWSTLVWRKPMGEWKPATDTELDALGGPGKPPPLPGKGTK